MREHRLSIERVEKMSRGVQGIKLRVGQDFYGEMEELMQVVGTEWELDVAIPKLKGAFEATERQGELKTARHVSAHAPTQSQSRWPALVGTGTDHLPRDHAL